MDKLAKTLDALRDQDLLDRKRGSRLGERQGFALDLDVLLDPTERQLGELDGWLKNSIGI